MLQVSQYGQYVTAIAILLEIVVPQLHESQDLPLICVADDPVALLSELLQL